MMSTVTCNTLLSRPAPSMRISSMPRLQPSKVAPAPAVALPMIQRRKLSPLSVCHAFTWEPELFGSVPNGATVMEVNASLVHPKFPEFYPPKSNSWKITEDADHINLWFKVEETTNKNDLKVAIKGNLLLIKYDKAKTGDDDAGTTTTPTSPAAKLDVRLLLPAGYDKPDMVEAELTFGSLLVTVTKPKQLEPNPIPIRPLDHD